ncbi:AbiJ-NTD4 domain-containing protein [Pedobacter suwonensis]|uniref:AbiJ-NTD4 domain-containing protein n=1 Tax=Pedobacter suwonensis TaxID=332999 RepID=UPI0011A4B524|nr:hypothetical protein [Pedobacter suwonensis]
MRFSQRIGKKPVKNIFQVENIDDDLKTRLWNIFYSALENIEFKDIGSSSRKWFYNALWKDFFNLPLDEIPKTRFGLDDHLIKKYIKSWFDASEWHEVYDFIEYLVQKNDLKFSGAFIENINDALRIEVSAYRILDKNIVQINSEEEISEINQAIEITDTRSSVNIHLKTALNMLSDRSSPDYRNSIKECISALEAYCRILIGEEKVTLGKALAILEKKYGLHTSLKTAFTALYGYTSDAGGIRHAILEDDVEIKFEDAKFMMVSCSSFINYLSSKLAL